MTQQRRHIFTARTQRRQFYADHIETMEQVFAEQAFFNALFQVLVSRSDNAHVHADRRLTTDAIELAFSQHAQQARLQGRGHVADLIEKQRSAIGLFEAAATQRVGTGERAALVAEQLGFQQFSRNG